MARYFILFLAGILMVLPGCREKKNKDNLSRPAVKIGVIGSFSGAEEYLGVSCLQGVQAALKNQGALDSGQKIELVVRDDHGEAAKSVSAFMELIKEKVSVVLVLSSSDCVLSIKQAASQFTIPILVAVGSHPAITETDGNISQIPIDDAEQAQLAALFAMDELFLTHAAVIFDESRAHYASLAANFIKKFQSIGGEVLPLPLTESTPLLEGTLEQLTAQNISFVYLAIEPFAAAEISGQLRQLETPPAIMGSDGLLAAVVLEHPESLGKLEGVYTIDYFSTDVPPTSFGKRIIKRFAEEFNSPQTIIAGLGAEAALVAIHALNQCSDVTDITCVETMIRKTENIEGINGKISIDADGKVERVVFINLIKSGSLVFLLKIH